MRPQSDRAATRPPGITGAVREARWENEGGATRAPRNTTEQPRLYADLIAEADRRRREADDRLVKGMVALRDPGR